MQTGQLIFIYLCIYIYMYIDLFIYVCFYLFMYVCIYLVIHLAFIYLAFIIIESYRVCAKVKGYLAYALNAYKACRDWHHSRDLAQNSY